MISIDCEVLGDDVSVAGSRAEDEFSLMLDLDDDVITLKGTEKALRTMLKEMLQMLDGLPNVGEKEFR
jgi:hypothetical protein